MNRESLITELKQNIIKTLNLVGVNPDDIDEYTPLFEADGVGLDSVDALELVVMVERDYKITVDDKDEAKSVFSSVSALADYIIAHK